MWPAASVTCPCFHQVFLRSFWDWVCRLYSLPCCCSCIVLNTTKNTNKSTLVQRLWWTGGLRLMTQIILLLCLKQLADQINQTIAQYRSEQSLHMPQIYITPRQMMKQIQQIHSKTAFSAQQIYQTLTFQCHLHEFSNDRLPACFN